MLPLITHRLPWSHCLSVLLARASGNPEESWGGTVTAIDTRLDLDIVQSLDFEYAPPCESIHHGQSDVHGGDAYVLVKQRCPHCQQGGTGYRCKPFMDYVLAGRTLRCDFPGSACGGRYVGGPESFIILGYAGGA